MYRIMNCFVIKGALFGKSARPALCFTLVVQLVSAKPKVR